MMNLLAFAPDGTLAASDGTGRCGRSIFRRCATNSPRWAWIGNGRRITALLLTAAPAQVLHPLPDLRLVPAVGRLVAAPLLRQVLLLDVAALVYPSQCTPANPVSMWPVQKQPERSWK